MKKLLNIIILIVSGIAVIQAQPVKEHGNLSVKGTNLVDLYGKTVMLQGVSYGWHNWSKGLIESVIQGAIENDMYVIIDWHSHGIQTEALCPGKGISYLCFRIGRHVGQWKRTNKLQGMATMDRLDEKEPDQLDILVHCRQK
jgi:hypothetical protein